MGTLKHFIQPNVSPEEWAFLAGVIEADGSIKADRAPRCRLPTYHTKIVVTQKPPQLVEWISEHIGGAVSYQLTGSNTVRPGQPKHRWVIGGNEMVTGVLVNILPYLVLKRKEALLGLILCKRPNHSTQYKIYKAMQQCKKERYAPQLG